MQIKIYHNPKCSKSRQALEILNEKNLNPNIRLYLKDPLDTQEIKQILDLLNCPIRDIMRTKESVYKDNNLDDKDITQDQLIKFIADYPILLERPIVICNDKAAICRPAEKIFEIL